MYIVELSNECSTMKGDHGNFGTSDAQLRKCTIAQFKGAHETTTVDGKAVGLSKLLVLTRAFTFRVPKHSAVGAPPGTARSVAYGYGLLLRGLSKGTHVIHSVANVAKSNYTFTFHGSRGVTRNS